jgi:hypothetical protein
MRNIVIPSSRGDEGKTLPNQWQTRTSDHRINGHRLCAGRTSAVVPFTRPPPAAPHMASVWRKTGVHRINAWQRPRAERASSSTSPTPRPLALHYSHHAHLLQAWESSIRLVLIVPTPSAPIQPPHHHERTVPVNPAAGSIQLRRPSIIMRASHRVHANPLNYEVIMAVLVCWSVGAPFRWQPLVEGRGARPFVLAGGAAPRGGGEKGSPVSCSGATSTGRGGGRQKDITGRRRAFACPKERERERDRRLAQAEKPCPEARPSASSTGLILFLPDTCNVVRCSE